MKSDGFSLEAGQFMKEKEKNPQSNPRVILHGRTWKRRGPVHVQVWRCYNLDCAKGDMATKGPKVDTDKQDNMLCPEPNCRRPMKLVHQLSIPRGARVSVIVEDGTPRVVAKPISGKPRKRV